MPGRACSPTDTIPKNWKFVLPDADREPVDGQLGDREGAQHPDAAYAFIDYMLQTDVSCRELDYIGYNTGVKGIAGEGGRAKTSRCPTWCSSRPT